MPLLSLNAELVASWFVDIDPEADPTPGEEVYVPGRYCDMIYHHELHAEFRKCPACGADQYRCWARDADEDTLPKQRLLWYHVGEKGCEDFGQYYCPAKKEANTSPSANA